MMMMMMMMMTTMTMIVYSLSVIITYVKPV